MPIPDQEQIKSRITELMEQRECMHKAVKHAQTLNNDPLAKTLQNEKDRIEDEIRKLGGGALLNGETRDRIGDKM